MSNAFQNTRDLFANFNSNITSESEDALALVSHLCDVIRGMASKIADEPSYALASLANEIAEHADRELEAREHFDSEQIAVNWEALNEMNVDPTYQRSIH